MIIFDKEDYVDGYDPFLFIFLRFFFLYLIPIQSPDEGELGSILSPDEE